MPRVKICDAVGKEDRRYRGTQQAAILALFGPVSRCVPSAPYTFKPHPKRRGRFVEENLLLKNDKEP